ncbi:MAG: potassium-transporting ATPase subunit KdpA [Propionicimonas sp.]|uniref:potassium-transporting ATPase subunit KdpA n=1 Tax=Propionicimonas sp. TaxID=1955623 RepID=UPI001D341CC1|nr:potassium-transporting ATPase subunit KdpA [Propionicimonas sp.]MBU4189027.1 potassium-transporting ATPase subunit KdpA [Actinomycetota bacterium]MBU4205714.1 potassium-transporting ATPase subunit KdpA [Actinomycetota bacterium]MBU4249885.1 potassium-transporting ATPase subunit KdpA [Actinomycetota bacterium]MBU4410946.1 potassium-transporting ATPase subunit KdpA [Actinomycetota bacterium]MBU4415676.1 potassium-transporting ATPase subunit KdpA [Actinomycetota bacterium]
MTPALSAGLAIGTIAAVLAIIHVPLGSWLYRVFTSPKHTRVERLVYRLVGVNPEVEQRWSVYLLAVLAFSTVSIIGLWLLILLQGFLPFSQGRSMNVDTAFNAAVSFVTNTNWQSHAGEAGAGYLVQAIGLTVQNFLSAGVGLAVAIAVVRGLAREGTDRLGNFWVDLVRGTLRVLLPLAAVAAIMLVAGGVIQNLTEPTTITSLTGGDQVIQGGLVASQEAIKELGTNGGGFFNANSAHPFENPNGWTNLLEILLLLAIPSALPYTYGRMVGDRRQGAAMVSVMAVLGFGAMATMMWLESVGSMEGKEQRFGPIWSAIFASATTGTSTGAVNSLHESFQPLAGGVALLNMMLGELSPGGVGTGLYSMLVMVVLAVFIAGLMVGRTPEFLGKSIGSREVTLAALAMLIAPVLVLLGTGVALLLPVSAGALSTTGPHGLSEMLYAFTSAANNNGSAFAGLSADQPFLNIALAFCMLLGRFVPIAAMLALAGGLASQQRRPVTAGTMPTHTASFAGLLIAVILILAGLTYFPSLALGSIAEALS